MPYYESGISPFEFPRLFTHWIKDPLLDITIGDKLDLVNTVIERRFLNKDCIVRLDDIRKAVDDLTITSSVTGQKSDVYLISGYVATKKIIDDYKHLNISDFMLYEDFNEYFLLKDVFIQHLHALTTLFDDKFNIQEKYIRKSEYSEKITKELNAIFIQTYMIHDLSRMIRNIFFTNQRSLIFLLRRKSGIVRTEYDACLSELIALASIYKFIISTYDGVSAITPEDTMRHVALTFMQTPSLNARYQIDEDTTYYDIEPILKVLEYIVDLSDHTNIMTTKEFIYIEDMVEEYNRRIEKNNG